MNKKIIKTDFRLLEAGTEQLLAVYLNIRAMSRSWKEYYNNPIKEWSDHSKLWEITIYFNDHTNIRICRPAFLGVRMEYMDIVRKYSGEQ